MLQSLNAFKFIMAFLNLIILYVVLRKVLFKPVMQFMDNRTKSIEESIANAQKQKAEAIEMKTMYEEQLKTAKIESKKILDAALEKAAAQQTAILAEAQQQAEELLTNAREEIKLEREEMIKDVRNEVTGLVFVAASKVMQANLDTESNRQMVNKFIDEAGAA